ncbi:Pentatricopeptide repeat-containing protein [Heracleum sosnowskyi]|uniref:Pentatricopeptide repeat-containing protein n=1 Tax=Heracleum sosnowskyi TaxID=360622 RepID=A0AAD8HIN9_9APIA|nr:Pentatricopeptide repeat-containing protein [Heracleum sosnowskyi]
MVLQKWVDEGNRVSGSELRRISEQLVKFKRYKHALEILNWMDTQNKFQMTAADHAIRLELIIKEHSIDEAEKYFEMNDLGLIVSSHPLNEMMKLYIATSQFEKVVFVIQHMKRNKIPRNVLSYNLWMTALGEVSGVSAVEVVYKQMEMDKQVGVGWSTLATLANIYIKVGLLDKATLAVKAAERKLSAINRLGYLFLMTICTSLNDKDAVLRLWEACKKVDKKITCANYMTIISSLVKLGNIHEAEEIFTEWEAQCRKYDIRISNILLGAYIRNGSTEKAEALHLRTLGRGGQPNYRTWEILMEGWVKNQDMEKAINAMKKGFAMLKHCNWRPSPSIVVTIAEYFERTGDIIGANRYVEVIRPYGLASIPVYKSLLRLHTCNQKPIDNIIVMMRNDNIEFDDEVSTLIRST